jgi:transcriptional regulator with XRE-family HTH domain
MSVETTGSTVPRRQLGRYLRELRNGQRLTVRAAAERLEWSEAKMWRIETGQSAMRSLDVQTMCQLYGADPDLTGALMGLAKETKARGWWHAYGDVIPEGFDIYIGLEEAAASIDWYESDLVPGLLQTEAYAREVITQDNSDKGADEIDRRIHLRLSRQRILSRTTAPPQLRITLNESILRRPVGSPVLMAGQLQYLAEVSELPNVSMRVVPFSRGFHPGVLSGPFLVLRFPRSGDGRDSEPPTVYSDGFTGALYLDKPAEIDRYEPAFTAIWATALEERISRTLILQAAKELQP